MTELSNVVKRMRNRLNLTQTQVADMSGVDQSYVSKLERGQSIDKAKGLAIKNALAGQMREQDRDLALFVRLVTEIERAGLNRTEISELIGRSHAYVSGIYSCNIPLKKSALEAVKALHADTVKEGAEDADRYTYKWPGVESFHACLKKHGGNRSAVAAELGVSRETIYNWLDKNPISDSDSETPPAAAAQNPQGPEGQDGDDNASVDEDFMSDEAAQIVPYYFDGHKINVVQAEEMLMTFTQLGEALGYSRPNDSISQIVAAHIDEIGEHLTSIDLTSASGSKIPVKVLRERGVSLVTFFSHQPKAKVFRKYAADVIFKQRRGGSGGADNSLIEALAKMVGIRTADIEGAIQQTQSQMAATQQRVEEIAAAVANVDQVVEDRLAAAELERRLVADGRGWIKRSVNLIAKRTEQRHSSVYAALFFALRVSRLDDVQARDQVLRAVDWLSATAKTCDLVLPAYQQMLPGVAV